MEIDNLKDEAQELSDLQTILENLRQLPYCTGTIPLDANSSTIFYRNSDLDSKAEFIDFCNPTDAQLEKLAKACQPATFGRNQQDVYNEAYRKAGKMDVSQFSTQFQPLENGIIKVICNALFGGRIDVNSIHVELYKLNVYGPGGFFKAHVDTPHGDDMFGSLVVILPTVHDGGSLILRKGGKEWMFDSAKAVNPSIEADPSSQIPRAAFVAFFSDVEHEVMAVSSGYRVTLTYNLYRKPTTSLDNDLNHCAISEAEETVKKALDHLLKNFSFLPKGGLLGFGLDHQYAISPKKTKLKDLEKRLKGMDDAIRRICESLSLETAVKAVYRHIEKDLWGLRTTSDTSLAALFDHFPNLGYLPLESHDELVGYLSSGGGEIVHISGQDEGSVPKKVPPVVWIKPLTKTNDFSQAFYTYGNEPVLHHVYAEVCLIAKVGSTKQRLGAM